MMKPFPARIHVLLAQSASMGLVIRRGPSRCVATVQWNLATDQFQLGQWLKGRIYERRSDLSPDGKHLIYFAMNGKIHHQAMGAWTAVSRAPYLKAIALYPKGDCWQGGGLWTNTEEYWVHGGSTLHESNEVRRNHRFSMEPKFGAECPSVYYPRLMRDGWELIERLKLSKASYLDVFEKRIFGVWRLRKMAHAEVNQPEGKGCYWDEHELHNDETGVILKFPDWEWADLDRDRLVWAACGRLFAGQLSKREIVNETELYDFNGMKFKPIEAPY